METGMGKGTKCGVFITALLMSGGAVGQTPATATTPAATVRTPVTVAKPALARLNAADENKLKAMIAQHQRVRSRLSAEDQALLDKLTLQVKKQLFAAPLQGKLLVSATQSVSRIIPDFTKQEAAILAEYVLGGIAGMSGNGASAVRSSQAGLASATDSQEMQSSFNLQYLQLQQEMQHENRQYELVSNIMKTKHDTAKDSISNIR